MDILIFFEECIIKDRNCIQSDRILNMQVMFGHKEDCHYVYGTNRVRYLPKCGKVSDFIIWESLNADIDPEAQVQLIDGTIFHFTCPECGHKSNVNYGMLYHDMTNRVIVHYVQEEAIDATINTIHEVEGK